MINSKDPDSIYTFVLVKLLARERKRVGDEVAA